MTTSVSICVATYKRPEGLKRLIQGLDQLEFRAVPTPDIEIVIVDNDAIGSARSICETMGSQIRWTLKYDVESEPGVTYARNRSIANASENFSFIAIIDDDEVPDPQWLDQLLKVQAEYDADIVRGPVHPHFEHDSTPEWIKKGKFFEPYSYETGHALNVAFTNNVLIKKECLKDINPIFDHRFALKGGEDAHLFMRLSRDHCKIVWAKEAKVFEWIPLSRTNLNWLIRRNFWGWSCHSLFEKELFPSTKGQIIRALKGFALITLGLISLPISIFKGKSAIAKSIINVSRGLGTFSGLIGFQGQW